MSESTEHQALAQFLRVAEGQLPALRFCKHTPNEANGGGPKVRGVPLEVLRDAAMGVRKGVWDWEFLYPNRQPMINRPAYYWQGIAIEMKVGNNGLSPEQREWERHYQANGWHTLVCYDWIIAAGILILWAGGNPADFSLKAGMIGKAKPAKLL